MNFKNKQAMRYGGKSNMATSYRNGGPGDDAKAGTTEEKLYGGKYKASDVDAAIEAFKDSTTQYGTQAYKLQESLGNIQDDEKRRGAFIKASQSPTEQGKMYSSFLKS